MPARLCRFGLACLLAGCGSLPASFQPRARILVAPSNVSRVVRIQLDNVIYQGSAQPGELKGQSVRLASLDGAVLNCSFSRENWERRGAGKCSDADGRQYDMLVGEDRDR